MLSHIGYVMNSAAKLTFTGNVVTRSGYVRLAVFTIQHARLVIFCWVHVCSFCPLEVVEMLTNGVLWNASCAVAAPLCLFLTSPGTQMASRGPLARQLRWHPRVCLSSQLLLQEARR
eukprot:4733233-Amphidinium_carterae.1